MKKKYTNPNLEIEKLNLSDVLTGSPETDGDWDLPPMEW